MGCTPSIHVNQTTGVVYCQDDDRSSGGRKGDASVAPVTQESSRLKQRSSKGKQTRTPSLGDKRDALSSSRECGAGPVPGMGSEGVSAVMPLGSKTTPRLCQTTPLDSQTTPLVFQVPPVVTQTTTFINKVTPRNIAQTTSFFNQTTPLVCQTTPLVSQTTPLVCQTTPLVCQTTPLVSQTTPFIKTTTSREGQMPVK